ncbi:MAG: c-type cytochrome [Rhodospirillales bacterium]|nr:c-type cytochrome [Rhodospirillales bacterium]
MKKSLVFAWVLVLAPLAVPRAHAASAAQGKAAFPICAACHSLDPGVNKIGPSLHGIIGSKAGTAPGFSFSPAMKKAGFSWTPAKLAQYIDDPQRVVPGNRMPYAGTHNMNTAKSIVDYLEQVSK